MRREAFALLASAVLLAAPACHGSSNPPPSTQRSTPPPTTAGRLTAEQARCVAEATFLIRVADAIVRVVPAQEATPGTDGMPGAIQTLQSQKAALDGRSLQPLFMGDAHRLTASAEEMIAGYEGLLGPGHHDHAHDRELNRQIAEGASMAATTQANVKNKRSACAP